MKYIEFDTGGSDTGLNGWTLCTSKKQAESLESQTRDVLAQKDEWNRKYSALENGKQASEWAGLKIELANLEKTIKAETLKLKQEQSIADSLGLAGACSKHINRRKRAENSLRDASNSLGDVKGRYTLLGKQQTEGIRRSSEVILTNKKTIAQLKNQLQAVKTKIANYKIERDNIKRAEAQTQAQAQANASVTAPKVNSAGILSKKNLPILAGVLFLGGVLYFSKNGKKTTTIKKKKVTKKVSA
ncbi:hypothetical protein F7649_10655 [Tenacibaculum piscium]|uniref:hypothetical protein n=1 Tax=Tenacibaculum piscium TaxID=1458515 RepID=UPI00187B45DC|nr:hypothetical protein [Tenacibaculum piscium]MBE7671572.1 hypothetical protein [Tenacibaculum piscium]